MKPYKALVIENESEVPEEVTQFCQRAINTGLFSEVEYNLNSRNDSFADTVDAILKADAIVVKSKWMYKDQLEKFVAGFAEALVHKMYRFFIWDIKRTANQWIDGTGTAGFSNVENFLENLRAVVRQHMVYDIDQDGFHLVMNASDGSFIRKTIKALHP